MYNKDEIHDIAGFISGFRSRGGGQMLSTKIKGGSGASTNYVIRSTKNLKGGGQTESKGGGGGQKHPLAPPPEINPALYVLHRLKDHTSMAANIPFEGPSSLCLPVK